MDTLRPPSIQYINKKQHIHYPQTVTLRAYELKLGLSFPAARGCCCCGPCYHRQRTVHFAVDKLGEIDDEVLLLARSKPEVEKALDFDRFYEHLHVRVTQCRYVISSPCARRKG
jgi:hypothetical protein